MEDEHQQQASSHVDADAVTIAGDIVSDDSVQAVVAWLRSHRVSIPDGAVSVSELIDLLRDGSILLRLADRLHLLDRDETMAPASTNYTSVRDSTLRQYWHTPIRVVQLDNLTRAFRAFGVDLSADAFMRAGAYSADEIMSALEQLSHRHVASTLSSADDPSMVLTQQTPTFGNHMSPENLHEHLGNLAMHERDHLQRMEYFQRQFLDDLMSREDVMASRLAEQIVANHREVIDAHRQMLDQIESAVGAASQGSDGSHGDVAKAILATVQSWSELKAYSVNIPDARAVVDQHFNDQPSFQAWLAERGGHRLFGELLVEPWEYMLRFPGIIYAVFKSTTYVTTPERSLILGAILLAFKDVQEVTDGRVKRKHASVMNIIRAHLVNTSGINNGMNETDDLFDTDGLLRSSLCGYLIADGPLDSHEFEETDSSRRLFGMLFEKQFIVCAVNTATSEWDLLQYTPARLIKFDAPNETTITLSYSRKLDAIDTTRFQTFIFSSESEAQRWTSAFNVVQAAPTRDFKEKTSGDAWSAHCYYDTQTTDRLVYLQCQSVQASSQVPDSMDFYKVVTRLPELSAKLVKRQSHKATKIVIADEKPAVQGPDKVAIDTDTDDCDDDDDDEDITGSPKNVSKIKRQKESLHKARSLLGVEESAKEMAKQNAKHRGQAIDDRESHGSSKSLFSKLRGKISKMGSSTGSDSDLHRGKTKKNNGPDGSTSKSTRSMLVLAADDEQEQRKRALSTDGRVSQPHVEPDSLSKKESMDDTNTVITVNPLFSMQAELRAQRNELLKTNGFAVELAEKLHKRTTSNSGEPLANAKTLHAGEDVAHSTTSTPSVKGKVMPTPVPPSVPNTNAHRRSRSSTYTKQTKNAESDQASNIGNSSEVEPTRIQQVESAVTVAGSTPATQKVGEEARKRTMSMSSPSAAPRQAATITVPIFPLQNMPGATSKVPTNVSAPTAQSSGTGKRPNVSQSVDAATGRPSYLLPVFIRDFGNFKRVKVLESTSAEDVIQQVIKKNAVEGLETADFTKWNLFETEYGTDLTSHSPLNFERIERDAVVLQCYQWQMETRVLIFRLDDMQEQRTPASVRSNNRLSRQMHKRQSTHGASPLSTMGRQRPLSLLHAVDSPSSTLSRGFNLSAIADAMDKNGGSVALGTSPSLSSSPMGSAAGSPSPDRAALILEQRKKRLLAKQAQSALANELDSSVVVVAGAETHEMANVHMLPRQVPADDSANPMLHESYVEQTMLATTQLDESLPTESLLRRNGSTSYD